MIWNGEILCVFTRIARKHFLFWRKWVSYNEPHHLSGLFLQKGFLVHQCCSWIKLDVMKKRLKSDSAIESYSASSTATEFTNQSTLVFGAARVNCENVFSNVTQRLIAFMKNFVLLLEKLQVLIHITFLVFLKSWLYIALHRREESHNVKMAHSRCFHELDGCRPRGPVNYSTIFLKWLLSQL